MVMRCVTDSALPPNKSPNSLFRKECRGFEVGWDKVLVSHLQHADDTILLVEVDSNGIENLKHTIQCFEKIQSLIKPVKKQCSRLGYV